MASVPVRVVYISRCWLPSHAAAGIRADRFITALLADGMSVSVITSSPQPALDLKSPSLVVARLGYDGRLPTEMHHSGAARWPCFRALPGPDPDSRFCRGVFRVSQWLIERYGADLICVSGPPFSLMSVANVAGRRRRLPVILDFRDAWYTGMPWPYSSGLRRVLAGQWERRCVHAAAKVITATDTLGRILAAEYPSAGGKIQTIRHGFERVPPANGGPTGPGGAPVPAAKPFTIVHTGQLRGTDGEQQGRLGRLIARAGRGARKVLLGARFCERLDLERMSGRSLLAGIQRAATMEPELLQRVRIIFAGQRSERVDSWAAQMGLGARVEQTGPVWPQEAQRLADNAALLVLMLYGIKDCDYHWCVPSKTYSYLATGRPILSLVPPGEARDLVLRAGTGLIAESEDPAAIAEVILRVFADWRAGRMTVRPQWRFIEQFTAARQQEVFVETVRDVIRNGR